MRRSDSEATTLGRELLDEFDALLRMLCAPIVDVWAPGLNDEEIDAVMEPLGIDLPEEARLWWRWHNGTREDAPPIARQFGAGRWPLSLREVAELHASTLDLMHEVWGVEGLLSPVSHKPEIYFGCAGPRDEPVPIYAQNDVETPRIVLPSIGELVRAWIELIQAGAWTIGTDKTWQIRGEKAPPRLIGIGIV